MKTRVGSSPSSLSWSGTDTAPIIGARRARAHATETLVVVRGDGCRGTLAVPGHRRGPRVAVRWSRSPDDARCRVFEHAHRSGTPVHPHRNEQHVLHEIARAR